MSVKYEVLPGPGVYRSYLGLDTDIERKELLHALATELVNGPNADKAVQFTNTDGAYWTALPLSFGGYIAIYRALSTDELGRRRRQLGRRATTPAFLVADILPPGSAFAGRPRIS